MTSLCLGTSSLLAPAVAVAEDGAADRVFVQASLLNLRADPATDGKLLGKLTVNSPLTVLERRDDWLRVRVDNGREGWLGAAFVAPKPLTAAVAVQRATEGPEAERLSWWQRATALDSSRSHLEGLATAYDKAGQSEAAAAVRAQLDWPVSLFLPADWGEGFVTVEWRVGFELGGAREHPRTTWSRYGLDPEEPWWALPAVGPAVKATPTRFAVQELSECSGESGRVIRFEVPELPAGMPVVALHRGAPPGNWRSPVAGDPMPKEQAEAKAKAAGTAVSQGREVRVELAPVKGGWLGHASWQTGEYGELGFELEDALLVRIDGAKLSAEPFAWRADRILGERDLNGDGIVERITTVDGCSTQARNLDRTLRAETAETCCGC